MTTWRSDTVPTVSAVGDIVLTGFDGSEMQIERHDLAIFIQWVEKYGNYALVLSEIADQGG